MAGYTWTIVVDGHETSSSVFSFVIYELACHQGIQERLYEDVTNVLANHDGKLTFEGLQEMEYLDRVMQETMRINVVAPIISRICTKEYTLPLIDGQKEPVKIYPGTCVQISVRGLHMYVSKRSISFILSSISFK